MVVHGNFQNAKVPKKLMSSLNSRRELALHRFSCFVLPSLLLVFLVACRRQEAGAARSTGRPVAESIDQKIARRIITLTPSLTELVFALGAGDRLVGVSDFCDYPEAAKRIPRVGSFLSPAIERILSLQPDLVLLDGVQADATAMLKQAGTHAVAVPMQDMAQVRAAFTTVAREVGDRQAQATSLLTDLDRQIADISARVSSMPRRKTLFVVDRQIGSLRGLVAAGPKSYIDELLNLAGGQNILADMAPRYAKVALETIEERQPEVILDAVHTDPAGAAARLADWQELRGVAAVRGGQVHVLANRVFVTPGPRLGEALRQLAAMLHPTAKATP